MTLASWLSSHLINSAAPDRLAADGQENVANVESSAPETWEIEPGGHWSTILSPGFIFVWTALTRNIAVLDIIYKEYRFQGHLSPKVILNVNCDQLSLAVFHLRDRNWPVSKAGLLQALNDDRLCVRTSEKDSLSISTFFYVNFWYINNINWWQNLCHKITIKRLAKFIMPYINPTY